MDPDKPLEGVRLAALQVTAPPHPEEEGGPATQRLAAADGQCLPSLQWELYQPRALGGCSCKAADEGAGRVWG